MKLLDVNILVQAHREDADRHEETRSWLETMLREAPGVAVTDLVLSGFLRVVTHPRVFREPTPLIEAIEFAEDLRARHNVRLLSPGKRHWEIFRKVCAEADARGNHIPDAFHAAVALEKGLEWISLDHGFSRFPELRWSLPKV